jgi:hypothetical protein
MVFEVLGDNLLALIKRYVERRVVVSELHRFSVSCIFTFAFETCYGLAAFHD